MGFILLLVVGILLLLNLIISIFNSLKLDTMGQNITDLKAALTAADAKVDKIAADVTRLHDLINGLGEIPTQSEWDEVKTQVSALNDKLQGVDDSTPE